MVKLISLNATRAIAMLRDNRDKLPIKVVMPQLEQHPKYVRNVGVGGWLVGGASAFHHFLVLLSLRHARVPPTGSSWGTLRPSRPSSPPLAATMAAGWWS